MIRELFCGIAAKLRVRIFRKVWESFLFPFFAKCSLNPNSSSYQFPGKLCRLLGFAVSSSDSLYISIIPRISLISYRSTIIERQEESFSSRQLDIQSKVNLSILTLFIHYHPFIRTGVVDLGHLGPLDHQPALIDPPSLQSRSQEDLRQSFVIISATFSWTLTKPAFFKVVCLT